MARPSVRGAWGFALLALGCGEAPDESTSTSTTAVRFPLEVVGVCPESGMCAEADLAVEVDGAKLASATRAELVLTVHNLVDPSMARLVVNDGFGLALGGDLVRAHGGVSSGRLELDPAALKAGINHFKFQYLHQIPDVSGYRVLGLEVVLDDVGAPLELAWENASEWRPPATDPAALERGRKYFAEESRDGGPVCARCHVDSGADLAYFAFSNHAIVERAKHHLFAESEALDIASHLRSLEVPRTGSVFDPPFQPGSDSHGAAGAGFDAPVDDATFGEHAFGSGGAEALPDVIAWDHAASFDFRTLPAPVQAPAWFRWLPREVDESWHDRAIDAEGTSLRALEERLASEPSLENAQRYMAHAVDLGSTVLAETGDHVTRIELLRLAAVKLWDWSRKLGFDPPPHGFPDGAPAYPYEVGFAFFEAAQAELAIPNVWLQTIEWWWVQLAVDPGRGHSNGLRPLNYRDVLIAAESAGLGPNALVALHLYGSWEESRGTMQDAFGTEIGPVRLLEVPLRNVSPRLQAALWRRFLLQQRAWLDSGKTLTSGHRLILQKTWEASCAALDAPARSELRTLASSAVATELGACP